MLEQLVTRSTALDKAVTGAELDASDGMELLEYENLHMLGAAADNARRLAVGDVVTFAASYYMNYTNLCAASCQMCAFYRKKGDGDAYTLSSDQIVQRVATAERMGATEVHIIGGFHPDLPLEYYEDMMRIIRERFPRMSIKAFTAAEIFFISKLTKNSVGEILRRLKDAGLGTLPGGGAEMFHPDVRGKVVRGKCTGQQWLDTTEQAHRLGIKSNVTMLYGHVEKPEHVIDHLIKIRDLQKKTGGFITMIPLKFIPDNTELEKTGAVTRECSSLYDLRVVAVSRLMLAGVLNNISVYWVAYGRKMTQVALLNGGNDLTGTAFDEEVYRAANRPTESSVSDLAGMIREIGRRPARRDTHFRILETL